MKTIIFDFETVPSTRAFSLLPPAPPLPEIVPDGRLKDPEKIKTDIAAKTQKAKEEALRKREDEFRKGAMIPNRNLIVCAGWVDADTGKPDSLFLPYGSPEDWESDIIKEFWNILSKYDRFVTFNGIHFDIPTLTIHSALHRIKPAVQIDTRKYQIGNHIDLYQILSNWGQNPKGGLDYYCRYFGLSSGKNGMDGSKVYDYWKLGKPGEPVIRKYCERDCMDTLKLYDFCLEYIGGF